MSAPLIPRISKRLRREAQQRQPKAKSKTANGSAYMPGVDGRSQMARRVHDIGAQIIADLGGLERISEAKLQLVRRFASAATLAEMMEANVINGFPVDIADYGLLLTNMTRITTRIGVRRRPKLIDVDANGAKKRVDAPFDASAKDDG
jgi:hypothetical protein